MVDNNMKMINGELTTMQNNGYNNNTINTIIIIFWRNMAANGFSGRLKIITIMKINGDTIIAIIWLCNGSVMDNGGQ